MIERSCVEKGYVGETYVIAKLIRKYNIVSVRVPQQFFSYDLITSNNKRLEVKTAILRRFERKHPKETYYSDGWEFRRNRRQLHGEASHFVVCVCFRSDDFSEEPRCFIVPSKVLQEHSKVFKISANPKRKGEYKFWNYENNWDAIANAQNAEKSQPNKENAEQQKVKIK
jgi:hypothetical protein